jgi:hypothetical protein
MHRSLIALPLLCALGCVKSKQPFYLSEDVVFSEILLGEWRIEREPRKYTPHVQLVRGEGKTVVPAAKNPTLDGTAQLFRLGDHYFLDVLQRSPNNSSPKNTEDKVHTLFKVSLIGDDLFYRSRNPDWLMDLMQRDPKAIACERGDPSAPGGILLTASTKELQAFIGKYIEDTRAFSVVERWSAGKGTAVAEEGFGSKRQRTLDYWYELRMRASNPKVLGKATKLCLLPWPTSWKACPARLWAASSSGVGKSRVRSSTTLIEAAH